MTARPPAPAAALPRVAQGRVLARACAAEWTRLWSVRTTWWLLAAAAVVVLGIGAAVGDDAAGQPVPPVGGSAWLASTVTALPAQFALLTLALTAVTSDYATGGIVPTLQWTSRRNALYFARTTVAVLAVGVLGVLLAAGAALAAWATARPVLGLPPGEGAEALGTVALVLTAGAALAVGLGFLLRSTAGGLVTVLLLMLVLPLLLGNLGYAWTSEVAEALPGSGAAFLLAGDVPGMSRDRSVTVLLAWAGAALLAGWLRLVRDDANR